MILAALFLAQAIAFAVVLRRLGQGRTRLPPVAPRPDGIVEGEVTALVPSYNEAARIGPCLTGLSAQGSPLVRVLVIDSCSTDGTPELVRGQAAKDARISVVNDPPLPVGWVGKVWALQYGLSLARTEWVLGVDADTEPHLGAVAGAVAAALEHGYDVVSFSPRFAGMTAWEQVVQPSMLLTLVYRFGAAGASPSVPNEVLANGQFFLAKRAVLEAYGGYESARRSWADDVSLARTLAASGVRVGFLDGSRLYDVRAYDNVLHMWREWGRSFDLSDATGPAKRRWDLVCLTLVMFAPWFVLVAGGLGWLGPFVGIVRWLVWLNVAIVVVRCLMTVALLGSYKERSIGLMFSALSDPLAVVRLWLSSLRRPTRWRGRDFVSEPSSPTPV